MRRKTWNVDISFTHDSNQWCWLLLLYYVSLLRTMIFLWIVNAEFRCFVSFYSIQFRAVFFLSLSFFLSRNFLSLLFQRQRSAMSMLCFWIFDSGGFSLWYKQSTNNKVLQVRKWINGTGNEWLHCVHA